MSRVWASSFSYSVVLLSFDYRGKIEPTWQLTVAILIKDTGKFSWKMKTKKHTIRFSRHFLQILQKQ